MSTGVTTDMALLQGILDQMEGVLPNDVGAVASYDGSRVRSDAAIRANSLKSAFGYRPYGMSIDLARYTSDGDERWQGKEFDGEHGKYYFGARFYDPFFGMWMSPDPAGQFANPYSYGGDPLNYIDPTGMWALGLGLVVGYDESHGWSFGIGAAAEFGNIGVNAAFSFNQDGSKSLSLSANASIPVFNTGLWINAGLAFNLNSYTGTSLSRSGGVCYGASSAACAGVEVGEGYSWDRSGGFNGMTVYAEAYVTYAGVRTSVGYEHGFFGAEGRGMYAGIGGYGLHAQVSQNGGFSWGFSKQFNALRYERRESMDYTSIDLLGFNVFFETDLWVDGMWTEDDNLRYYLNHIPNDNDDKLFLFGSHGNQYLLGDTENGNKTMTPEEFAKKLKNKEFYYKGEKTIKLYSCETGKGGKNSFAQKLANEMGVTVIAPTTKVHFKDVGGESTATLKNRGKWVTFKPQPKK